MTDSIRVAPEEYQGLQLRAHVLLSDVPLHDAWAIDLAGGPGRTVADVRALLSKDRLEAASLPVRFLFGLRWKLGRVFGWDREPRGAAEASFIHRLSAADRDGSLVAPGTPDGPFRALFVSRQESISEIQNATVHAFSVMFLQQRSTGYRLYWAIHVRPVGPITGWYMRLIDPFRRRLIYPALLRLIRAAWTRREAG